MSRWLKADYSVNCSDDAHKMFQLFAGLMALVYPLGIPCMYALELYKIKKKLNPSKGQKKLLGANVVKHKIDVNSDESKDGYVVGDEEAPRDAKMNWNGAEYVVLDEEGALRCSLFLRSELEKEEHQEVKLLYGNYEPSCWWFEIFETCRCLLLTAGVSFLRPGNASQILFSIICGLGSMRLYSGWKPFINPKLDRLAEVMQW